MPRYSPRVVEDELDRNKPSVSLDLVEYIKRVYPVTNPRVATSASDSVAISHEQARAAGIKAVIDTLETLANNRN